MTVFPVPAAKNIKGNFAAVQPAVISKQGQCCALTIFVFSLDFYFNTSYVIFLILSLYAYTVYMKIYILHIFLYLCILLSWEWCDYVIFLKTSNDFDADRLRPHLQ